MLAWPGLAGPGPRVRSMHNIHNRVQAAASTDAASPGKVDYLHKDHNCKESNSIHRSPPRIPSSCTTWECDTTYVTLTETETLKRQIALETKQTSSMLFRYSLSHYYYHPSSSSSHTIPFPFHSMADGMDHHGYGVWHALPCPAGLLP